MIQSGAIYQTSELAELGIGRVTLEKARASGLVVPRKLGNQFVYKGDELIQFADQNMVQGKTQRKTVSQ